jgi:hypothetical protein
MISILVKRSVCAIGWAEPPCSLLVEIFDVMVEAWV